MTMRDALDELASELQAQACTMDVFDIDTVADWSAACVQVLRAMPVQNRDEHLASFAIVLVLRAQDLGRHGISCREVKEVLSRMLSGETN